MRNVYTWQLWDWKTIRNIFLFILFLFIVFIGLLKFKEHNDGNRNKKLSGLVDGEYQSMIEIKRTGNSLTSGTSTPVNYFEVKYFYKVNGQTYFGTCNIFNNSENVTLINGLKRRENKKLHLKYNPFQPAESEIINY